MLTLNKRLFAKDLCLQKPLVESLSLTERRLLFLFIYFFFFGKAMHL